MTPEQPPGLPPELWERVLAYQQEEEQFRERKNRFLSSFESGDDRMMDRALVQLTADEETLKTKGIELSRELRERFGMEL